MAVKSWQPSHEPSCGRKKTGTCRTDKTEREGGKAGRTTYEKSDHVQENANAQAKRSLKANRKTHFGPRAREILAYAHI